MVKEDKVKKKHYEMNIRVLGANVNRVVTWNDSPS